MEARKVVLNVGAGHKDILRGFEKAREKFFPPLLFQRRSARSSASSLRLRRRIAIAVRFADAGMWPTLACPRSRKPSPNG